jgi:peptidoglycan hydrolase CwlO-like protein
MDTTIVKLKKLHLSVQNLETALHEVWSDIDDLREHDQFSELLQNAKQHKKKKQSSNPNMEELSKRIDEFESSMREIPEDGTVVIDFEDTISELIDWLKK